MKRFSVFVVLLLASAACAQIEEIKSQRVPFGGTAQQYAIVQMVTPPSGNYLLPCPDCSATAEITKDGRIYQTGPMVEEKTGFFGITLNGAYAIGGVYSMRAFIVSPTYGNGTADSYITVIARDAPVSVPLGAGADIIGGVTEDLAAALGNTLNPITELFKPVFDVISPALTIIKALTSGIVSIWEFASPYLAQIGNWMLQNLKDFVRDPIGTIIKNLTNAFIWASGLVLFTFGGFFIVIQLIGLMKNVDFNDPVRFLSGMVMYNIGVVKTLGGGAWKMGQLFTGTIQWLRNVKTGTIGDAI